MVCSPASTGESASRSPSIRSAVSYSAAGQQGVEVTALGSEWRGRFRREGLQLGFAAVPPEEIRRGVEVLAHVLDGARAH